MIAVGTDGRPEAQSDQLPKVPNEVEELRERFKELSETFKVNNAELRESIAELNRKMEKVSFPTRYAILTWLTI